VKKGGRHRVFREIREKEGGSSGVHQLTARKKNERGKAAGGGTRNDLVREKRKGQTVQKQKRDGKPFGVEKGTERIGRTEVG